MAFHMKFSVVSFFVLSVFSLGVHATVDYSHGTIIGQDKNNNYSVDLHNEQVWNGVTHDELTSMQTKGWQMQQAANHAKVVANYGVKGSPDLVSQHVQDSHPAIVTTLPQRPATGVIITQHPPFAGESWGNTHGANNGDHGRSGTGNGSNNAANSNSAHGLGGGDHIGGGRSGGGYHY